MEEQPTPIAKRDSTVRDGPFSLLARDVDDYAEFVASLLESEVYVQRLAAEARRDPDEAASSAMAARDRLEAEEGSSRVYAERSVLAARLENILFGRTAQSSRVFDAAHLL